MTMNVLIAEDSRAVREIIRLTVEQMPGFANREASGGFDALNALLTRRFDLIITYVNMPDTAWGLGLYREAFQGGRTPGAYKEHP